MKSVAEYLCVFDFKIKILQCNKLTITGDGEVNLRVRHTPWF